MFKNLLNKAILFIFLSVSSLAASVDLVQDDSDFIFNPDYSGETIPVFTYKDEGASKRGAKEEALKPFVKGQTTKASAFLPKGSFIQNLDPKENTQVRDIHFAYIADRPECSKVAQDLSIQERLVSIFNDGRNMMKLNDAQLEGNVRNVVLKDNNIPGFCFRMGRGFTLASNLSAIKSKEQKPAILPKLAAKTEATILSPAECADCKKDKGVLFELKTTAQKVAESLGVGTKKPESPKIVPPPADEVRAGDRHCGPTGQPRLVKEINVIPVVTEYRPYVRKIPILKTNSKGERYKEYKEVSDWFCEISLPEGCNENIPPLRKVAAIANYFQSNMSKDYCKESLEVYYENCGVWRELSEGERFKKIAQISENVIFKLQKEMRKEFSHQLTPELIQCIAKKETGDLDPSKVVELACDKRMNPAKRGNKDVRDLIGDHHMASWTSDAIGLGQVRYFSLKDHWRYYLKNEIPLHSNPQKKTYEEIYGDVDKLFDELLDKPELQIEIMTRQLNRIVTKFKTANGKISDAILSYDARDRDGYLTKVLNCKSCLLNRKGNIECLKRAR